MNLRRFGVAVMVLGLSGCGVGEGDGSVAPWEDPPAPVVDTAESLPGFDDVEPVDVYYVKMETTKGEILIEVHPEGAPRGAKRFKELVEEGFYDGNRFFRVVPDFVIQFGINGDPEVNAEWSDWTITDDKVQHSNVRGTVTFATSGVDSRTTQVFINLADNTELDFSFENFAPFGRVIEGMEIVDSLNAEYEERPDQFKIGALGNEYLDENFPGLDYIIEATVVDGLPELANEDGANSEQSAGDE